MYTYTPISTSINLSKTEFCFISQPGYVGDNIIFPLKIENSCFACIYGEDNLLIDLFDMFDGWNMIF